MELGGTMTFDELWDVIVNKNKNLQTDTEVKMTVKGFKKALKLAYDKGHLEGKDDIGDYKSPINDRNFDAANMFETLFHSNRNRNN